MTPDKRRGVLHHKMAAKFEFTSIAIVHHTRYYVKIAFISNELTTNEDGQNGVNLFSGSLTIAHCLL